MVSSKVAPANEPETPSKQGGRGRPRGASTEKGGEARGGYKGPKRAALMMRLEDHERQIEELQKLTAEGGPRKTSQLPRAKRAKIDPVPHYNRFPYDDAVDSDDGALAEAIYLFAEKRRSFAALQPRHAAALLKHLCDDALLTPALQESIRLTIDAIEGRSKEARQAARRAKETQKELNDCDDPERINVLNFELAEARAASDRCADTIADLKEHSPLRRDMLGDDRRWSRYYALKSDAAPSLLVRISTKDPRCHATNVWRTVEEGPLPLRKGIDNRGSRECHLAELSRTRQ